jgi:hypothetical protein
MLSILLLKYEYALPETSGAHLSCHLSQVTHDSSDAGE